MATLTLVYKYGRTVATDENGLEVGNYRHDANAGRVGRYHFDGAYAGWLDALESGAAL